MKYLIFIVAAGCCLELLQAQGESGSTLDTETCFGCLPSGKKASLKSGFYLLNDYLEKNVDSQDSSANLDRAAEYLATSGQSLDGSLIEALELFTALKQDNLCTEQGLNVLLQINEIINDPIGHSALNGGPRVKRILKQTYNRMKHSCKDLFGQIVRSEYGQMDQDLIKRLVTFVDDAYYKFLPANNKMNPTPQILFDSNGILNGRAKFLFQEMIKLTKDDPDSGPLIKLIDEKSGKLRGNLEMDEKMTFKYFFFEYLIKPCEHHNQKLHKHLFQPISDGDIQLDLENNPYDKEYYLSYIRHQTCTRLLREEDNDDFFQELLGKILSSAQT